MKLDSKIINILKKDVARARSKGEIPVSAVVIDQSGRIISHAYNNRQRSCNVLGHAEILAILKAERKIKDWRLDGYKMIVVLEPCNMCSMIISKCRIDEVFYFVSQRNHEGFDDFNINKKMIKDYDDEKDYFSNLLISFFNNMR